MSISASLNKQCGHIYSKWMDLQNISQRSLRTFLKHSNTTNTNNSKEEHMCIDHKLGNFIISDKLHFQY